MGYRVDGETVRRAFTKASDAVMLLSGNRMESHLELMEQTYNIKVVPHIDGGGLDFIDEIDVIFPTEHDYTLFLLRWS